MATFGKKTTLMLCIGILSAVTGSVAVAAAASTSAAKKKVSIAWLAQSTSTYTAAEERGIRKAAKESGNVTVKTFSANFDPQTQVRQCNDVVVSGKYNAMVIYAAAEGSLVPCIKKAIAKKIMISSGGTRLGTAKIKTPGVVSEYYETESRLGANSFRAVRAACKAATTGSCKVGWMLAQRANPFSANRLIGTQRLLSKNKDFDIVAQGETGFSNPDAGRKLAIDMLQAHPTINVLVTDDDDVAAGVELGVKASGKKVQILGFGTNSKGYAAVKAGRWFGSLVNVPETYGYRPAKDVIGAVRGTNKKRGVFVSLDGLSPIGALMTKDNASKLKPQW